MLEGISAVIGREAWIHSGQVASPSQNNNHNHKLHAVSVGPCSMYASLTFLFQFLILVLHTEDTQLSNVWDTGNSIMLWPWVLVCSHVTGRLSCGIRFRFHYLHNHKAEFTCQSLSFKWYQLLHNKKLIWKKNEHLKLSLVVQCTKNYQWQHIHIWKRLFEKYLCGHLNRFTVLNNDRMDVIPLLQPTTREWTECRPYFLSFHSSLSTSVLV